MIGDDCRARYLSRLAVMWPYGNHNLAAYRFVDLATLPDTLRVKVCLRVDAAVAAAIVADEVRVNVAVAGEENFRLSWPELAGVDSSSSSLFTGIGISRNSSSLVPLDVKTAQ